MRFTDHYDATVVSMLFTNLHYLSEPVFVIGGGPPVPLPFPLLLPVPLPLVATLGGRPPLPGPLRP